MKLNDKLLALDLFHTIMKKDSCFFKDPHRAVIPFYTSPLLVFLFEGFFPWFQLVKNYKKIYKGNFKSNVPQMLILKPRIWTLHWSTKTMFRKENYLRYLLTVITETGRKYPWLQTTDWLCSSSSVYVNHQLNVTYIHVSITMNRIQVQQHSTFFKQYICLRETTKHAN